MISHELSLLYILLLFVANICIHYTDIVSGAIRGKHGQMMHASKLNVSVTYGYFLSVVNETSCCCSTD